jgi:hypothetical protein
VENLAIKTIWKQLLDVNHWSRWQNDLEYVRLYDLFKVGSKIYLKRKDYPTIEMLLINIEHGKQFETKFSLSGAKVFESYELVEHQDGITIKITARIQGYLSRLWRVILVKKIVLGYENRFATLIDILKSAH